MTAERTFEIKKGPSKWELMLAFFDPQGTDFPNSPKANRRIEFIIHEKNKKNGDYLVTFSVYRIDRIPLSPEGGVGDDFWELNGYLDENTFINIRKSTYAKVTMYCTKWGTGGCKYTNTAVTIVCIQDL